jgi:hydrogenase-4 membrane subunit HyfE
MVGYLAASNSSALCRCLLKASVPVLMEVASMLS